MKNKILFVEDEKDLRLIVSDVLIEEGFEIITASDGKEGIEKFRSEGADIVVADVMMPKMDGFSMVKEIRKISSLVPVLFLTAKSRIEDIEEGFEIGANDYIRKPFELRELIVRTKALLRRYSNDENREGKYYIGKYLFNIATQTISYENSIMDLSNFEARILELLVNNIGKTVDATELMLSIWQRDELSNRNSLHGYIHKLRGLLKSDPSISIINQRGFGYMLSVKRE